MHLLLWPISLLALALAAIANATPVDLEALAPDNFASTIAHGIWFIEHFSPYCSHCRHFAPTWGELVEDFKASPENGINLAQVNCATHGDLCDANGVKGYPQLHLYRDGELVDQYNQAREFKRIKDWLLQHAPSPITTEAETYQADEITTEAPTPTPVPALRVQSSRETVNPSGSVISLDSKTFPDILAQGPVFVKFFAPWCGHCKKLAPTWVQLAKHMQGQLNVAEVNCEEHKSLCKAQDIEGYPTLFYYSDGVKTEYTGSRKIDQLKEFTAKAAAPPVHELQTDSDLETAVSENPVVYLLLHSSGDQAALDLLKQTASVLLGTPPVYASSSPSLFSRYHLTTSSPVLLVFKDFDVSTPLRTLTLSPLPSPSTFTAQLTANRVPSATELTQDNFQQIMNAPHHPLVVITPATQVMRERAATKTRELGKKWRHWISDDTNAVKGRRKELLQERDVVFVYMDADRWGKWLKSMYGLKADSEGVVITDHQTLVYWDTDSHGEPLKLASTSIFPAIADVISGTIKAKHSENIVERFARYLNGRLAALESFIVAHRALVICGIFAAALAAIYAIRKVLSDEPEDTRRPPEQKTRKE